MGKVINLVGKKFGRLLVIKKAESKNGNTYWTCQCECGKIKDICGKSLRRGLTKSCGCLHKEIVKNRAKDLKEMKFGKLTVLERVTSSSLVFNRFTEREYF